MDAPTSGETLRRLRALLRSAATFRQAEVELDVPRSTLHRLAEQHDLPRRRRGLSPDKERRICEGLRRRESQRAVARLAGVSRWAVWSRYWAKVRKISGEYRRAPKWRCPQCGALLDIAQCVVDGAKRPPRGTASRRRQRE